MLSAALRSASSSSLSTSSHQPGSAGLTHSASASLLSSALLSTSPASSGHATPPLSLLHDPLLACEGDEALEMMCGGGFYEDSLPAPPGRRHSRDSTCSTRSSHDAAGAPVAAAASSAGPLLAGRAASASAACTIPASSGSAAADGGFGGSGFASMQIARSCPKPISMPRRSSSRPSGLLDDLDEFVPPHLMASSLMDSANVSESLARKGSAALRLRAGVLRRTGYLEGHTETLRGNVAGSLAQ